MKEIFTKIHKSKTLLFNWVATLLPLVIETAVLFLPEARSAFPEQFYFYYAFVVTIGNKLLRAKTNSSLLDK